MGTGARVRFRWSLQTVSLGRAQGYGGPWGWKLGAGHVCGLEREEGGLKAKSMWSLINLGLVGTTAC